MTDPYSVLGVSRDVTDEELTKAYRKLAKKYHPDLNRDNKAFAERKMAEINAAYEQIKDIRSGRASSSSYGGYSSYSDVGSSYGGSTWQNVVRSFIGSGQYGQALSFLTTVSERTAEWYFYCAVAYSGSGSRLAAIQYAQKACNMDPTNESYRRLLEQLQGGAASVDYTDTENTFNFRTSPVVRWCFRICLLNLFCNGLRFCC